MFQRNFKSFKFGQKCFVNFKQLLTLITMITPRMRPGIATIFFVYNVVTTYFIMGAYGKIVKCFQSEAMT